MIAAADLWPYVVLVLVGFLPSDLWRFLGVVVGHGLDEESELIQWVRAIAIAVLAGVIAKLVLLPPAALAVLPLSLRLAAIAVGFATFLAARQSVSAGLVAGEAVLLLGGLMLVP
jgi:hypothetical protein